jgi:hypothetical protein
MHRVGRVLSFFSSRRNWDSPTPSPADERAPLPFGSEAGGGPTRFRQRGWVSPNSEGTYTVYFVLLCISDCAKTNAQVYKLYQRIHPNEYTSIPIILRYGAVDGKAGSSQVD